MANVNNLVIEINLRENWLWMQFAQIPPFI